MSQNNFINKCSCNYTITRQLNQSYVGMKSSSHKYLKFFSLYKYYFKKNFIAKSYIYYSQHITFKKYFFIFFNEILMNNFFLFNEILCICRI